jgi:energy-coupling factor transport system substrate-specific component
MSNLEAGSADASLSYRAIPFIAFGILLNLVPAAVISALKLPIYIDAVGTILITLSLGVRAGILTGVLSFLIGGLTQNPVMPFFAGTQAAIAIYVHLTGRRGWFRNIRVLIPTGIGLGIVAAFVSAPVIVRLFGGLTNSGASLIVAFLLASGKSVINSVILSGLGAEPLDKTAQCLIVFWLLKGIPKTALAGLKSGSLPQNKLVE